MIPQESTAFRKLIRDFVKTEASPKHSKILILDFGSQYTQVIGRRIRELQVYSEIVRFDTPAENFAREPPNGIILSGGPASVYENGAPQIDPKIFDLGIPILGICYGLMQMAHHPEVAHTPRGREILQNFVYHICRCTMDWTMGSFIEDACERVRAQVGDNKVVLGLSGGVDSSVVAALLHKAIGDQLTCIFVNNGL